MRRAAPALLGLVCLVLAAPTGALQALGVTHFHQGPCLEQFVGLPIPMAEAMALAPAGFPPKPWDTGGLSPAIPALATGVTVAYECAATTGDGGLSLGEVRTIGRAILVDPPAELRDPGIVNYVIILGGWTSSPELAQVYTSWHLPKVEVGLVSFNMSATPNARLGDAAGESAAGRLQINTLSVGVEEAQQADTFRLFGFVGGRVAGYADWSWPAGAQTIESGLAVQTLQEPLHTGSTDVDLGASFHYFGAYEYNLAFTALDGR